MYRRLLILTAAFVSLTTYSQAQWFARGAVTRVQPLASGYSAATGGAITAGRYLGHRSKHELSLDVESVRWRYQDPYTTYRETYMPVLLNYRYHMFAPDKLFKNAEFYIGPSVGYTQAKVQFRVESGLEYYGLPPVDVADTVWVISLGGSAGFIVRLYRNVEIDLGYRYTHTNSSDLDLGPLVRGGLSHANFNIFYLGVGARF